MIFGKPFKIVCRLFIAGKHILFWNVNKNISFVLWKKYTNRQVTQELEIHGKKYGKKHLLHPLNYIRRCNVYIKYEAQEYS